MSQRSTAIQQRYVVQSDTAPGSPFDGQVWLDTSGGNVEMNQRRGGAWELIMARGPDAPEYPVAGALWGDTGAGATKRYTGSAWQVIGVSSHDDLSGVTADDHLPDEAELNGLNHLHTSIGYTANGTTDILNPAGTMYVVWGMVHQDSVGKSEWHYVFSDGTDYNPTLGNDVGQPATFPVPPFADLDRIYVHNGSGNPGTLYADIWYGTV